MADFYVIIDPDEGRVAAHAASASQYADTLPYPIREEYTVGQARLVLLRNDATPCHVQRRGSDVSAVSIGAPFSDRDAGDTADGKFDAAGLENDWGGRAAFGVLVHASADGTIRVSSDRLGLFPVYCFAHEDVLLAASTPSLIVNHPDFNRAIDPVGLTGILLFSFPSGTRTIWRDVKRLAPGHTLTYSASEGIRSLEVWRPGIDASEIDSNTAEAAIDAEFSRWVQEQPEAVNLQLSGGLDSRIVAGYLCETQGMVKEAWTYGSSRDLEASTARRVAHACGFPHRVLEVDVSRYPEWAGVQIAYGHLSNAVSDFGPWEIAEYAGRTGLPVVTGHLGDIILGGNHLGRGVAPSSEEAEFAVIRERLNLGYGISEQHLHRLLRFDDVEGLIETCVSELFESYAKHGKDVFRRGWWFDLLHRDRLNVGRLVLQIARYAWPLIPYCEPTVVERAATLPESVVRARSLQQKLVAHRFPKLAVLPLDRGQLDVWPIQYSSTAAGLAWRVGERVRRNYRRAMSRWFGVEPRVNHRLWDFNQNPGWGAIRMEARRQVEAVEDLMDVEYLLKLVPPADQPARIGDALGGSGLKTIAGVVLWARAFL